MQSVYGPIHIPMKHLAWIAIVVFGLSQRPPKTPDDKGVANGSVAQVTDQATASKDNNKPTLQALPVPDKEELKTQRELTRFTGALVVVSFLQFVALVWQACLFFRQTRIMDEHRIHLEQLAKAASDNAQAAKDGAEAASKNAEFSKLNAAATEKSANAAKASADALIDGERSWLLVDEVEMVPLREDILITSGSDHLGGLGNPTPRFTYRIRNFGKTPAVMMGCKADFQVGNDPNCPPDSTIFDLAGTQVDMSVIPPGQSVPKESKSWQSYRIPPEEKGKIASGESFLWACGCVYYTDVFKRQHNTPFCYLYLASQRKFWPCGEPQFNLPT